jgi:hypothetical protein
MQFRIFHRLQAHPLTTAVSLLAAGLVVPPAFSQKLLQNPEPAIASTQSLPAERASTRGLPDAPTAASDSATTSFASAPPDPTRNFSSSAIAATAPATTPVPEATPADRHIQPGQSAPLLTARDKVRMGLRGIVSPFAITGWFTAAGYEQLSNSSPNWGTDRGAFGQRLGTGAVRASTEGLLSNSVMAPLLHEDPRYYRLGSGHNPLARFTYAITRPVITRTDSGRAFPNLALMGGNLAGSILTNAYYPAQNRGGRRTIATFSGSLGGSAFGSLVTEFLGGYFTRLTR